MKNELTLQQKQERQTAIDTVKQSITLDSGTIQKYGNSATTKIADFSSEILKSVKMKDSPEVGELLMSLMGQLNSIDCTSLQSKKPTFFQRLRGKQDVVSFMTKFESVDAFIEGISKKLEQAEFSLGKDIETYEKLLEQNRTYIAELDIYIEAGRQYVADAKAEYEDMKANIGADDALASNELSILESQIRQFEKKLHDLDIQRTIAIQNIPQIMLLKDGVSVLTEKIDASINISIPLWKNQMTIALGILKEENGVKLVKGVSDINNQLMMQNADLLKTSSVAVAQELERGIVDISTLQHTNEALINTIKEITQIRNDGQKNREAATIELANIQKRLIETTMASGLETTKETPQAITAGAHPIRYSIGGN